MRPAPDAALPEDVTTGALACQPGATGPADVGPIRPDPARPPVPAPPPVPADARRQGLGAIAGRLDLPLLVAGLCVLAVLAAGTAVNPRFASPRYLLQQGQVGSFLGLVALGQMLVVLLGHIDLSVPWTIASAAMLATGLGGDRAGGAAGLAVAVAVGAAVGLVNGLGVARLRVPSMIFTLGTNAALQGLMVLYTGGSAPPSTAPRLFAALANGQILPPVPNAVWAWAGASLLVAVLLRASAFGRAVYAIGNRERAAFLCALPVRRVVVLCFVANSVLCACSGVLLAGYAGKAYQGMGDGYLLPAIAAVVLGGTSILGGRGRVAGTLVGTVLVVLLQSMLSVLQMPDAGRQIIYGAVILVMLLFYGRQGRPAG